MPLSFLLPPLSTAPPPRARHGARLQPPRPCARRRILRVRASGEATPPPSRTQMIMDKISGGDEVGGAGGAYSYEALKRLDRLCSSICESQVDSNVPEIVTRVQGPSLDYDLGSDSKIFDVLVCGGTLGIFIATALSYKGLRVGIIERNIIKGREQEWNISRKELMEIVEVGILSEGEVEQIITSDFNPNRCAFENKGEIWMENILHLGISRSNF
ncbi:uncharacterized protein LOC124682580 isoform X3 [Lolium rigidum]|uniref:uncharacterized protein LOC124682580 isoform X3 n=1 Tax=Lolium rigidum TaxID=89674 RepID=UPI001F5CB1C2|nr:uncharacterized protein LOC124682580 isoform X3 [Lolium rigidum]